VREKQFVIAFLSRHQEVGAGGSVSDLHQARLGSDQEPKPGESLEFIDGNLTGGGRRSVSHAVDRGWQDNGHAGSGRNRALRLKFIAGDVIFRVLIILGEFQQGPLTPLLDRQQLISRKSERMRRDRTLHHDALPVVSGCVLLTLARVQLLQRQAELRRRGSAQNRRREREPAHVRHTRSDEDHHCRFPLTRLSKVNDTADKFS
jgi:hypothetical protein